MKNKKVRLIVSALISVVIATIIVAITVHLFARFELRMLSGLVVPIVIVFFISWSFVYYGMFKKKKKK